jgi:uncharacterized membrane protein YvlD (DUF360 family)
MGHIITDLKETFRRGNTFIRLIYINVGIFVIGTLISVILQLFNLSATGIFDLFALPVSLIKSGIHPVVQHALAVLVRKFVSLFLFGKAFTGIVCIGRYLRRIVLHDSL